MQIQIDNREGERINFAEKYYKTHEVEIKQLETADYIFKDQVAFEYKTLTDFIHSVQSGRLTEQAIRLNQQFPYPFVIIQGSETELKHELDKIFFMRKSRKKNKPQKFTLKHFYGAIDSLNCYVTVIMRPTMRWCFEGMLNQARKCLDSSPINRKVAKTGNPAYQCLRYCIAGVGPKTAAKITGDLCLESLEDLFSVSVEGFSSVSGVSLRKAEVIYNKIHSG